MQTFKAVFTKTKLTEEELSVTKQYTFNSTDSISVDDIFYSNDYKKFIQVTYIYSEPYHYVNVKTGELSNSNSNFPFVKIKIISKDENKIDDSASQ